MKKGFLGNKTVLVTGSSGTIGTALCELLLSKGVDVIGVDIKPNPWSPTVQKKTVIADIRKPEELEKLPFADFCVHLAANALVFPSVQNPSLAFDNVLMTLNALEFCRKKGIKRFVFASSREVYGNTEKPVHVEDEARLENAESPYAASKLAGEAFVHSYQKCFGIDFQILRFSNVYGGFDNSNRFIPLVICKNLANEDIPIFGENKSLSFTYIDDAVEGVWLGLLNFEKAKNQCLNLAFPKMARVFDVAVLLQKEMNAKNRLVLAPIRTGEVEKFGADISKAKALLGFNPKIGLEEGIAKTWAWYRANVYKK